jgi:hypothetical protein
MLVALPFSKQLSGWPKTDHFFPSSFTPCSYYRIIPLTFWDAKAAVLMFLLISVVWSFLSTRMFEHKKFINARYKSILLLF